jgi:hypothetical protein
MNIKSLNKGTLTSLARRVKGQAQKSDEKSYRLMKHSVVDDDKDSKESNWERERGFRHVELGYKKQTGLLDPSLVTPSDFDHDSPPNILDLYTFSKLNLFDTNDEYEKMQLNGIKLFYKMKKKLKKSSENRQKISASSAITHLSPTSSSVISKTPSTVTKSSKSSKAPKPTIDYFLQKYENPDPRKKKIVYSTLTSLTSISQKKLDLIQPKKHNIISFFDSD